MALCQLRKRTPSTNWTVLSSDVPEFFLHQREILACYEQDDLRRVPITHQRGADAVQRRTSRLLLAEVTAAEQSNALVRRWAHRQYWVQ